MPLTVGSAQPSSSSSDNAVRCATSTASSAGGWRGHHRAPPLDGTHSQAPSQATTTAAPLPQPSSHHQQHSVAAAPDVSRYDILYAAANKQRKVWKEGALTVGASRAVLYDVAAKKTVACCTAIGSSDTNKIFKEMAQRPNAAFEEGELFAFNAQWVVQVLVVMHAHLRPYGDDGATPSAALGAAVLRRGPTTTGRLEAGSAAGPHPCTAPLHAAVSVPPPSYSNPYRVDRGHCHVDRDLGEMSSTSDAVVAYPNAPPSFAPRIAPPPSPFPFRRTNAAILHELRAAYPAHYFS